MKRSKTQDHRTHLIGTGVFVSVPGAFPGVTGALQHFAKVNLATQSARATPTKTETVVLPDRVLFDLGVLRGTDIDPAKLAVDCDLVRRAALDNPKKVKALISAAAAGDFRRAAKLADAIGLSEAAAMKQGGGLLMLVVLVVLIVAASGCTGCAHGAASKGKNGVLPDYGSSDAGSPDGG